MNIYKVEKWLDVDFYTEGPVVDRDGNLYVTTLRRGEILRIDKERNCTVWARGDCPNGQVISEDSRHLVCESLSGRVASYAAGGEFGKVLIDGNCAQTPVTAPNDLALDKSGNLYFTDSVREKGKVFYLGSDGVQRLLAEGIDYANGLALDLNEERLYIAESYANRILVMDLVQQGGLLRELARLPRHPSGDPLKNLPDGLAVDREGRIWVAHYGMQALQVLSPEGVHLHTLDTGLPLTSNLAFVTDTPAHKQIVVTGGYGEPGPGAVMMMEVCFGVEKEQPGYTRLS